MVKIALEKIRGSVGQWPVSIAGTPEWRGVQAREAMEAFEKLGFPGTRHEDWRYTNVTSVINAVYTAPQSTAVPEGLAAFFYPEAEHSRLVFVDGIFNAGLTDISGLGSGVIAGNLAAFSAPEIEANFGKLVSAIDDGFTALNTATSQDGAFLLIPRGAAIASPIHLLFYASTPGVLNQPRVLIIAGEGSSASVIESYVGAASETPHLTNAVTEVVVGRDAKLTHYRLQEESLGGYHIANTGVRQDQTSTYANYSISLGAAISRQNLNLKINGQGSESVVDGLYLGVGTQHIDNHTTIDHACRQSGSSQLYKGILDDSARAVFNGRILVREGAILTDARQLNKNLLLSPTAHVDTKPQLEIFTDDVKCAHGATVGQLEGDELFYLMSRGLKPEAARALLTFGFAEDVISKIAVKSVRRRLDAVVLERLHQQLDID